jgi:hypothetical protein
MRHLLLFKITLYTALLSLSFHASAQEKSYVEPNGLNNWFVELGGTGLFYSFNFESVLYKGGNMGWTGRVGFAYNPANYTLLNKITLDKNTVIAPFTTSVLWGSRKEKLELGAGFTLVNKGISEREVIPTAILGFRVVEMNKVFFRVAYTPIIRGGELIHWYGVSIGRNFRL